jgi:tRNA-2-methylthio-N6-dimethylallyladenosine synthase
MLKAMARNHTREQYVTLVEKMRRAMPGMALSTDIIAGFRARPKKISVKRSR